jgi:hypothetical protein
MVMVDGAVGGGGGGRQVDVGTSTFPSRITMASPLWHFS